MKMLDLVVADPNVCHGEACIKGTRVPVSVILDCLAAGMSTGEILREYPSLPAEAVRASAAYGAALAKEELIPFSGTVLEDQA